MAARFAATFLIAIIASITIAISGAGAARAQDGGDGGGDSARVVEGVIVNGTDGGAEVGAQSVTLHRVGADGSRDLSAESDADGAFRFEFDYDPDLAYGVSVRYQSAVYGTDLELSAGSPDPISLAVYESTSDDGVIGVRSASILLAAADSAAQTVAALEILRLVNDSDTAYVPGEGVMELLRFGLPPGADDLTLDTRLIGADFIQVDRGFALLASVPPGEYDVMFSYTFPYETDEFTLSKTYRYGADSARALAAEDVLTIESDQLGEPKSERIGERMYRVLEADGFTRGAAVEIRLSDLPARGVADRAGAGLDAVRFEYAAPAALAVLMVALLVYGAVWRSGAKSAASGAPASSETVSPDVAISVSRSVSPSGESDDSDADADSDSDESESAVVRAMIADLSADYNAGTLSAADYRRRRAILDARLSEMARRCAAE